MNKQSSETYPSAPARLPSQVELVINYHITEACNYDCKFCYAKWGKLNELRRQEGKSELLIELLADYFLHSDNPIKQALNYHSVRLNFAGGEPFLLKTKFESILAQTRSAGFKTSIITNGHFMSAAFIERSGHLLDMVGVSFDSQDHNTRIAIGRADSQGHSLCSEQLKYRVDLLRQKNPQINIKINTVVNELNWQEDFNSLINQLLPSKWKVLQVMPSVSNALTISNQQFDHFVKRHTGNSLPISAESNLSMTESYLMINPKGQFYQNQVGSSGYVYSDSIISSGVAAAINQIRFDTSAFLNRYK